VLQLLGGSPLLVLLGAFVGGTDGLGSEAVLSSLLSQVVAVGLGLVGLLSLLSGSLGLGGLVGLGDGLTDLLVVPGLLTGLAAPALLDLLASVTGKIDDQLVSIECSACRAGFGRMKGIRCACAFPNRYCFVLSSPGTGNRLRLASAGLAVATATVAATGTGGLLGLIGGLLTVVGAASGAVTESYTELSVPAPAPIISIIPSPIDDSPSIHPSIHVPASLPPVTRPPRRGAPSRGWVEGASLGASRLPTRGAGRSTALAGGAGGLLGSSSGSLPVD
jgi:hypothetical protein